MFVPLDILTFLKCKDCHKYLSATPVKNYPNRIVKCYRCSKDDPNGVVSLYGKVAEYLKFPCTNHRQGCDEILSTSQTIEHEGKCLPKQELCPICRAPPPNGLRIHAMSTHKKVFLKSPEFALLCDNGDYDYTFFYELGRFLVTFHCAYDGMSMRFCAFQSCSGQSPRKTLKCRADLYSIENVLVSSFNTKVIPDVTNVIPSDLTEHQILMENYPRGIVMVRFELKEDPVLILPEPADYQSFSGNQATITWEIPDISNLLLNGRMESNQYFVNEIPWRIVLKKTYGLGTTISCLGIYLKCDKDFSHNYSGEMYKVLQEFTLVSCDAFKNVTEPSKVRDTYRKFCDIFGSSAFVTWEKFVAPENGYIHEGRVKLILKIDVQVHKTIF